MKTKAVRLYGKNDLRIEEFELRSPGENEILARVVSDSTCMSTYKAVVQGADHKRVPADIDVNPIIIGHEFAGEIVEVGKKLKHKFQSGQKFSIQPNINYLGKGYAPGYSFTDFGGNATYIIIPYEVMEKDFLIPYHGDSFYKASLAEPLSCIIAAFRASYHIAPGSYKHVMGTVKGGKMALLAGAGPMGLGAIDYALHCDNKPSLLLVVDIDQARLNKASTLFTTEYAARLGIELIFINTTGLQNPANHILSRTNGEGFDDVLIFAPVNEVVELGDQILGRDGCLNFFAGPTDKSLSARINLYNVHYMSTHLLGTSGGDVDDMRISLKMMERGLINPSYMVSHIGGLNAVPETIINLISLPFGKKLIYNNIDMELTAIEDFSMKGQKDPRFNKLAEITQRNHNLWCDEAEKVLLENW